MSLKDRISSEISGILDKNDNQPVSREFFFYFSGFLTLILVLLTGLDFLFQPDYLPATIFLSIFSLVLLGLILFPPERKYTAGSGVLSALQAAAIGYGIYTAEFLFPSAIWMIVYPVSVFILLGERKAGIFALVLAIAILPKILLPDLTNSPAGQENSVLWLYTAYLTVLLLLYSYKQRKEKFIGNLVSSNQQTADELEEKNRFISSLSHQLRTSLSNVILVNNLINSSVLNEKQKELVETLQASTNSLSETISKIADMSGPELTQIKESNISFDLRKTLESITRLFRNNENYKVELNISEDVDRFIIGDPIKLKQIFLNIIQTMLLFKDRMIQTISIRVFTEKETPKKYDLRFIVRSTHDLEDGTPPKEDFSVYSLEFDHKLDYPESLVKNSEGDFYGRPLKDGYECEISLPFEKDTQRKVKVPDVESLRTDDEKKKEKVKLENANVLLVEDNLINQKIVLLSLQDMVNSIDVAANGKEALDKFGTSKYDVILMDLQMPVMDGIVATRKIRELESSTNSSTPIIAITANALSGVREKCLAVGMDDYISKPFQVDVLILKMKNLLSRQISDS